jgi:hypothetical protein
VPRSPAVRNDRVGRDREEHGEGGLFVAEFGEVVDDREQPPVAGDGVGLAALEHLVDPEFERTPHLVAFGLRQRLGHLGQPVGGLLPAVDRDDQRSLGGVRECDVFAARLRGGGAGRGECQRGG